MLSETKRALLPKSLNLVLGLAILSVVLATLVFSSMSGASIDSEDIYEYFEYPNASSSNTSGNETDNLPILDILDTPGNISINIFSPANQTQTQDLSTLVQANLTADRLAYLFLNDSSLVAYWTAENGANDSSEYHNDGSFGGTATTVADGKFGRAFEADGAEPNYINLGMSTDFDISSAFTVSVWVKNIGNSSGHTILGEWDSIITKWDCASGCAKSSWWIGIQPSDEILFIVANSTGSRTVTVPGTTKIRYDSIWHHVVGIYDGSYLEVYLDGEREGQVAYSEGVHVNSTVPLVIAGSANPPLGSFNGSIDELMIFNRSLSESEVRSLYNATAQEFNVTVDLEPGNNSIYLSAKDTLANFAKNYIVVERTETNPPNIIIISPANYTQTQNQTTSIIANASDESQVMMFLNDSSLVGYWTAENGANDSSEYHNDGTFGDNATTSADGKFGRDFAFNGLGEYVSINVSSSLNITDPMTISLWVKFNNVSGTQTILSTFNSSIDGYYIQENSANTIAFIGSWDHRSYIYTPENFTTEDTWYLITVTINGTLGKLYINGNLTDSNTTLYMALNSTAIYFGKHISGQFPLNGSLDEVMYFNRCLGATEVLALYNATAQNFNVTVDLEPGNNSIHLSAKDTLANFAKNYLVIQRIVPPSVSFVLPTPSNGTITANTSVQINSSINASDLGDVEFNWSVGPRDGLVLDLIFDDGSLRDYSGMGNDGTNNGSEYTPQGAVMGGREFNGMTEYIDVGNDNSLDITGNITLSAWIKAEARQNTYPTIIAKRDTGGNTNYQFYLNCVNRCQLRFGFGNYSQPWYADRAGNMALNDSLWHYVTVTYNGSDYIYYVDGNVDAINQETESLSSYVTDKDAIIGYFEDGGSTRYFNGSIDEVKVFNRSLSQSEIKELYYNSRARFYDDSLVLMYNFDNLSAIGENSSYVVDASLYRNDANVTRAVWNSSGRYGGAYSFNGVCGDDYIKTPNSSIFNMSEFSVSAWIYSSLNKTTPVIVADGDVIGGASLLCGKGARAGWALLLYNKTKLSLTHCNTSSYGKNYTLLISDGEVQPNTWTYVSLTFDSENINFYVNGVLSSSFESGGIMYDNITTDITVGAQDYNEANNFNGTIDEVRVWNRSLSASEIWLMYESNLKKFNVSGWSLYTNKTNLSSGNYDYITGIADTFGNTSDTGERLLIIDASAPVITFITENHTQTFNTSLVVDVNVSDSLQTYAFLNDSSLVGYWTAENGANDSSRYHNDGTFEGDATTSPNGKFGRKFTFDGTDAYIETSNFYNQINDTITLSVWVNPSSCNGYDYMLYKCLDCGTTSYDVGTYSISCNSNNSVIFGGVYDSTYIHPRFVSNSTLSMNNWTHITVTYDGNNILIYLNGNLDKLSSFPGHYFQYSYGGTNFPVRIGRGKNSSVPCFFNGSIDEVMIFSRTLSASEIQALYNATAQNFNVTVDLEPGNNSVHLSAKDTLANFAKNYLVIQRIVPPSVSFVPPTPSNGTITANTSVQINSSINSSDLGDVEFNWSVGPRDGLVLDLIFDDGSLRDYSGMGNDGTNNGSEYTPQGAVMGGRSFEGLAYQGISVNVSSSLESQNLTISAWVKTSNPNTSQIIATKRYAQITAPYNSYILEMNAGTYRFGLGKAAENQTRLFSITPTSTNWVFVAGTYDGVTMKIYVNGVLENQSSDFAGLIAYNGSLGFFVGNYGGGWEFNGSIDEVKVYNRSLSQSEVEELYHNSRARFYDDSLLVMYNFDENTLMNDSSLQDNNGRCGGTDIYGRNSTCPNWTTNGRYGGAYIFNGHDSNNTIKVNLFNITHEISSCMWVKPLAQPDGTDYLLKYRTFVVFITNNSEIRTAVRIGQTWYHLTANYSLSLDNWHHVCTGYNNETGVHIYVDGDLVAENDSIIGDLNSTYADPSVEWAAIGSHWSPPTDAFDGVIDEFRLWNRSLSASEIQLMYESNLREINSSVWNLYTNKTNLSIGNYSYKVGIENTSGASATTELRELEISDHDVISVHSCQNLSVEGATYLLEDDITFNPQSAYSCFNITAANISFDGQGHSIDFFVDTASIALGHVHVIYAHEVDNISITSFNITRIGHSNHAIELSFSDNSSVYGNSINMNGHACSSLGAGVDVYYSDKANVSNNIITPGGSWGCYSPRQGIYVQNSQNGSLTNNTFYTSMDRLGITLQTSINMTLANNSVIGSFAGYAVFAYVTTPAYYNHTIGTDNTVNGLPYAYFYDVSGTVPDISGYGAAYFTRSSNFTVKDMTINGSFYLKDVENYTIANNTFNVSDWGITIKDSDYGTIDGNNLTVNRLPESGTSYVFMMASSYNNISNNNFSSENNCQGNWGIDISHGTSTGNRIENNTASSCYGNLMYPQEEGNIIRGNNFTANHSILVSNQDSNNYSDNIFRLISDGTIASFSSAQESSISNCTFISGEVYFLIVSGYEVYLNIANTTFINSLNLSRKVKINDNVYNTEVNFTDSNIEGVLLGNNIENISYSSKGHLRLYFSNSSNDSVIGLNVTGYNALGSRNFSALTGANGNITELLDIFSGNETNVTYYSNYTINYTYIGTPFSNVLDLTENLTYHMRLLLETGVSARLSASPRVISETGNIIWRANVTNSGNVTSNITITPSWGSSFIVELDPGESNIREYHQAASCPTTSVTRTISAFAQSPIGNASDSDSATASISCGSSTCSKAWSCGEWGDCINGSQTRNCSCACPKDSQCTGDHETTRDCDLCGSIICEDDGNPCTSVTCIEGICVIELLDGVTCSDGDNCTLGDYCKLGLCIPGKKSDKPECIDEPRCDADWVCSSWSECSGGLKTRMCECSCESGNCHGDGEMVNTCEVNASEGDLEIIVIGGEFVGDGVNVTVLDENGNPVDGATIQFITPDGHILSYKAGFKAYERGKWAVMADKNGYAGNYKLFEVNDLAVASNNDKAGFLGVVSETAQEFFNWVKKTYIPISIMVLIIIVAGAVLYSSKIKLKKI